ncbi:MAG: TetR/AcrR family transcriptional regulator [bacterium]|nr:TetR/AcrR family transcriptional regulator [bacterium]
MPTRSIEPTRRRDAKGATRSSAANGSARRRILAAAIQVFGTYGFSKSTVQEIAAAAHVSKPLFYRQFENKQDVFEAVIEQVFDDWHEAMTARVARISGSTSEALRALFIGVLEYAQARPLLNHLLARDSQLLLSTQSDVWDRACDALRDLITQILRRGVARGEVRSDVDVEHMSDLLTEINFVYVNRQLHTGMAIGDALAADVSRCLFGAVSAHAPDDREASR